MVYTVYLHTFPNGKRYVGVTNGRLSRRWGHCGSQYKKQVVGKAIDKYGWDNIVHEILLTNVSPDEIDDREKFFVALFRSDDRRFGYNIEPGGVKHKTISPETREKQRAKRLGKHLSDETKKKISESHMGEKHHQYGKPLPYETRQKISNTLKGRPISEDALKKRIGRWAGENNPNFGKHLSEETRMKLSKAHKGKRLSEETRKKLSESHKGRVFSEESKKKIGDKHKKQVKNLDTGDVFDSCKEAAEFFGIHSRSGITICCKGRSKTCGGYRWAYADGEAS